MHTVFYFAFLSSDNTHITALFPFVPEECSIAWIYKNLLIQSPVVDIQNSSNLLLLQYC